MRALIFVAAAIAIYFFVRWLLTQPPRAKWQFAAVAASVALIALAMTGRLHWIAAALGAVLPFVRRIMGLAGFLPALHRLATQFQGARATAGPSQGQTSTVQTAFLRMVLDHDSGEMEGEVLQGPHRGQTLGDLTLEDLESLFTEYENRDPDSATLLSTYLQRRFGDQWQARQGKRDDHEAAAPHRGAMSTTEALAILGLETGASREDIVQAHRRLMQKFHPDRGGSTYFAAKINQAKDVLLAQT